MMDNWEPAIDEPIVFERRDRSEIHTITYERFQDGSAYICGADEVIFEQKSTAWRDALEYLEQGGYARRK